MSYCRFENTYNDLRDCAGNLDEDLSDQELKYKNKLIKLCVEIALDYGHEVDRDIVEYSTNWT
jgi:hypothetical protein